MVPHSYYCQLRCCRDREQPVQKERGGRDDSNGTLAAPVRRLLFCACACLYAWDRRGGEEDLQGGAASESSADAQHQFASHVPSLLVFAHAALLYAAKRARALLLLLLTPPERTLSEESSSSVIQQSVLISVSATSAISGASSSAWASPRRRPPPSSSCGRRHKAASLSMSSQSILGGDEGTA